MMKLIVTEKPSVAKDIAKVLNLNQRKNGYIYGENYAVTWCIGHLVSLSPPDAYRSEWQSWNLKNLPMIPDQFKTEPSIKTYSQWRIVCALLQDRKFESVINACDAGREGELIFRHCYDLSMSRLEIERLWISSMTEEAILNGFKNLKKGSDYNNLYDAAKSRSEADWLVGMNATRGVTVSSKKNGVNQVFSIGRVQTPTLSMIVERENAIRNFNSKDFFEVEGSFSLRTKEKSTPFICKWFSQNGNKFSDKKNADSLIKRMNAFTEPPTAPRIVSRETRRQRSSPPRLFDLTSLQRVANRLYGFPAQRTLDLAQDLYERHKAITYPRTDSDSLSTDMFSTITDVIRSLSYNQYIPYVNHILSQPLTMSTRIFNNARVSDHHAIIPTIRSRPPSLSPDEARIFELIARRFLSNFYCDAEFDETTLLILVGEGTKNVPVFKEGLLNSIPNGPDFFIARGRICIVRGWQDAAGYDEPSDIQTIPNIPNNTFLNGKYSTLSKKTKPPVRFTDDTILTAMENVSRNFEDESLKKILKDKGLGTPATRAAVLENLIQKRYIERKNKYIVPTVIGESLIRSLEIDEIKSPIMTAEWENRLNEISKGKEKRSVFMKDVKNFVEIAISKIKNGNGVKIIEIEKQKKSK